MSDLIKEVAIIVAHPDDETLWAGGTILSHTQWNCFIISLCRGSDEDRSPKFRNALKMLNAEGIMGDMDDGPEQFPLKDVDVEQTILNLLPHRHFDLVITHNPNGEYTRHQRHEETGRAVIRLWHSGMLMTDRLWSFAYEDNNRNKYPEAVRDANLYLDLPEDIWLKKYRIITQTYGFKAGGFEAETTPHAESFWRFDDAETANNWLVGLINLKT
jgi:LmbE family N-acetylglucosaminyl deacetylase